MVQLHKILFERVPWESLKQSVRDEENVRFERDAFEAISWVRQGANVAFLMNPARIEQVREVAFSGGLLPQKSTHFFPQLLSGLSIYALDNLLTNGMVALIFFCFGAWLTPAFQQSLSPPGPHPRARKCLRRKRLKKLRQNLS